MSDNDEEFIQILKVLDWDDGGFKFLFAVSSDHKVLLDIIEKIKKTEEYRNAESLIYQLPGQEEDLIKLPIALIETIPDQINKGQPVNLTMVLAIGLEEKIEMPWRRAVARINEHRNMFIRQHPVPLMFMGPPQLIHWVRFSAPDLFSVHSHIFKFKPINMIY